MNKNTIIGMLAMAGILLLSFVVDKPTPNDKIRAYYSAHHLALAEKLQILKESIVSNMPATRIRKDFFAARMVYKEYEFLLEYYFELDVAKFNGPPIPFLEEEDPTAHQEPQGLQMIESLLFPTYDTTRKNEVVSYIDRLTTNARGLASNADKFKPESFVMDALMESIYNITTLSITGFDSQAAEHSLEEIPASLSAISFTIGCYRQDGDQRYDSLFSNINTLIRASVKYLARNRDFVGFDRMEFIKKYLNPLAEQVGELKISLRMPDNPFRYTTIKRRGSLFRKNSLQQDRFIHNDQITEEKIQLGKKLFYDRMLSENGMRSCGSCHNPELGFTDGLQRAVETDGHTALPRNTPTLWNSALQRNLFSDNRQASLDDLILEVLGNAKEMNSSIDVAGKKIRTDSSYLSLYNRAYQLKDTMLSTKAIVNAIGIYVRTLISYDSPFDKEMRGEKNQLTPDQVKGFNLFMGKAKCGTCHFVPFFNGSKPPSWYYQETEVLGVPASTKPGAPVDPDPGRYAVLKIDFLRHSFKTPTLRNITKTAPYMHNGVFKTLEEVMDFYNVGGGAGLGINLSNQTLPPDPLALTPKEKTQVIAFLHALTDEKLSPAY